MGYRLCLAGLATFSDALLIGAPSPACSIVASRPNVLHLAGITFGHEKVWKSHVPVCGGFASVGRINRCWGGTAIQRRAFSIDKGKRWAAAAAAVTLSKRREPTAAPCERSADVAASAKDVSPAAENEPRCVQSNSGDGALRLFCENFRVFCMSVILFLFFPCSLLAEWH